MKTRPLKLSSKLQAPSSRETPSSGSFGFLWLPGFGVRTFTVWSFIIFLLGVVAPLAHAAAGADTSGLLGSWLNAQTNIHSWSAEFTQTRTLKSLTQPLTAAGHVWFAEPNRFRWELGQPPQTIAVRAPNELLLLYPRLKRVERFPLTGRQAGQWRDALSLLETGFPRSQTELESRYVILAQIVTNRTCQLLLEPKSSTARRMIPQLRIAFDTQDFSLRATQLQFADGSTMRDDFTNAVLNAKIDSKMFEPDIPADYKVVEPLKK